MQKLAHYAPGPVMADRLRESDIVAGGLGSFRAIEKQFAS